MTLLFMGAVDVRNETVHCVLEAATAVTKSVCVCVCVREREREREGGAYVLCVHVHM